MPNFQEQLDEIPFEEFGGREEVYESYSRILPYLDFEEENTTYGVRQAITIGEGPSVADVESINKGVAVLWYTDNLLYAEADTGDPEVGIYSGYHFFDGDKNIEFALDEEFSEGDADVLEDALEP